MPKVQRIRVVLRMDRKKVPAVLVLARAIYDAMLANPALFPAPNPTLAVLLALIMKLEASQLKTLSGTHGTAAARDTDREALCNAMETERTYVQSLCDASPDQAMALIKAAGMDAYRPPTSNKPVLVAKPGQLPGSVLLVANGSVLVGKGVRKKAVFNWQSSADGGKTWVSLPATPLAKTAVSGLTAALTYAFRVSVTVANVTYDWSQAVTIMVR
jgi:hypothetical protein